MTDEGERRRIEVDYDVMAIRERYLKLTCAMVYDALALQGYNKNALDTGMYPLVPEMKLAGPAFTVHYVKTPVRDEKRRLQRLEMIRSFTPGCIQVRDTQGDMSCGQFGEISATAAKAAGCVGAMIEGTTRDSNFLIDMGFPTFCRGRNPVEAIGNIIITDYQISIFVQGIDGKLIINPGDYVFGDNDGVVVIPKAITVKVLEEAERIGGNESRSRAAMANGEDPVKVYDRFGTF